MVVYQLSNERCPKCDSKNVDNPTLTVKINMSVLSYVFVIKYANKTKNI